jgi:glycosyltransferase involved in cell wall biosynthesis
MSQTQRAFPLVAIVTPVYNGEKYLAETMDCVQALDYPRLVHIVLDNASTDATPEIISRYRDGRVPVVTSRNKSTIPMLANFNAAVRMVPAEARYFRLLCADDMIAPNAISRQVEVAERYPDVGIVGSEFRVLLCELKEGYNLAAVPLKGLPKDREVFDGKETIRSFLRHDRYTFSGCEVLIRRSKLEGQIPFYDMIFRGAADTDANLRACINSKFGFVHDELTTLRHHQSAHYVAFSRSNFHMPERLLLLKRYGPLVWSDLEYRERHSSYRRYYLRRLLLMRWRDGKKEAFKEHLAILREYNDPANWLDFADALAEWAFRFVTRRRINPG